MIIVYKMLCDLFGCVIGFRKSKGQPRYRASEKGKGMKNGPNNRQHWRALRFSKGKKRNSKREEVRDGHKCWSEGWGSAGVKCHCGERWKCATKTFKGCQSDLTEQLISRGA